MNITDELERLARLRKDGTLSDEEFAQAKKKVLAQPIETATEEDNRLLARAVNRYVWLQTLMALVGIVIFLVFLFGVVLPMMRDNSHKTFQIQVP
ncbi:MAG TPA: SHOCT domain-containing protein [Verrucomicrobiae bacterium]|nr:SHOCT domain-containing protein [Verrucomicrobiae bacterium]